MGETPIEPERPRFASARDEALHLMAAEGWADDMSGDVDSPIGWFARVTNLAIDLEDIRRIFGKDLDTLGINAVAVLGHYLLTEVEYQPAVEQFDNTVQLDAAYNRLDRRFLEWRSAGGND